MTSFQKMLLIALGGGIVISFLGYHYDAPLWATVMLCAVWGWHCGSKA